MMRTFLWLLCGVVCVTMGCSTPAQPESYAVGTRLGGGSLLFGADTCTYTAAPSVADISSSSPHMAFLVGPGEVKKECPNGFKATYRAEIPTGAVVTGPPELRLGRDEASAPYHAVFVSGRRELYGEGEADWSLGEDCKGVAEFIPTQDHGAHGGGRQHFRALVPNHAGVCTIRVTLTSVRNSIAPPSFQPLSFAASLRVVVK